MIRLLTALSLMVTGTAYANESDKKFAQLEQVLPTPNVYRDATGAPGPQYWQQRADYDIKVTLDEDAKTITGSETITYTNNAPRALRYIWLQLDQNRFAEGSLERRSETAGKRGGKDTLSFGKLRQLHARKDNDFGHKIARVADARGNALPYTIVDTHMRIDLPEPLGTGEEVTFSVDWSYTLIQEAAVGGRGGYEWFEDSDTYIYFVAQWFPRLAALTDYTGWQHKAFLGRGEFTLEFGDYDVEITVPSDHIVSATGVLTNGNDVLTSTQRKRLKEAEKADKPMYIVTPDEAAANEKEKASGTKTWRFTAENVRDFAFSSSRKFVWDAMAHKQTGGDYDTVMAMSFFPNEADPIWSKYSTESVVHTMDVYSKYSFPYPYPTAQSVNTWDGGGMEYPMITFNGYRPTKEEAIDERTYTRRAKYGLIGVVIHEIGHIYFPMVVNSDERQWTWMDEGINSFLEYVAEVEWEKKFPATRDGRSNLLDWIPSYMVSENQVPVMTQSDSVLQFGPNAYAKPAAALTVLRETVMGRELFDHAFREYARRWKYKRPTPADLFRTLEDASGVDLDWFWRGWFYTTDHVDVGVSDVRSYKISSMDPRIENPLKREEAAAAEPVALQETRNTDAGLKTRVERRPELRDFYNENDRFTVTNKEINDYTDFLEGLNSWERRAFDRAVKDGETIIFVDFVNKGGIPTPIPLTLYYEDGSSEAYMIPAEIWRRNDQKVTKMFVRDKQIKSVEIDKHHQTADADFGNNFFPQRIVPSRLELYQWSGKSRNMMKEAMEELKSEDEAAQSGKAVPLTVSGR